MTCGKPVLLRHQRGTCCRQTSPPAAAASSRRGKTMASSAMGMLPGRITRAADVEPTRPASRCRSSAWAGRSRLPAPAVLMSRSDRRAERLRVGANSDDLDVAVFRFTLGIPGFDDALIPRVAGFSGAALILANHYLGSSGGVQPAQERAEVLGMFLAVTAFMAPSIETRLKELDPGRGRQAEPAGGVPDSTNVFCISPDLTNDAKQELAWASFALIKNTNTAGLMVVSKARGVLVARGSLGTAAVGMAATKGEDAQAEVLARLSSAAWDPACSKGLLEASRRPYGYFSDAAALYEATNGRPLGWLPGGANSLLVAPCGDDSWLCMWSERARAMSKKEQLWAAAFPSKLAAL